MKQTKLYILTISLLLGALLLTACSSDALPGDDSGIKEVSRTDSCYINLRIVNDVQAKTRGTDVGTAEENAIYDGILVILEGNGESSSTLKKAVIIDQLINNPGFTTDKTIDIIQRLPIGTHPYPTTGKLYVMALLNTTKTGFSVKNDMLYLNGTSLSGYTRAQIQSSAINSVGSTDQHVGLYMASKPKGEGSTPDQVALQIYDPSWDPSNECYLYDSKEAISQSASINKKLILNVERAAAKVSVTNGIATTLSNINLNGNNERHPQIHKMTWALNHYYTTSYAISGGSGGTLSPITFTNSDFTVYPQRSLCGDAIYIAEGSNTEVIVEVQLKDASSMLMHECFVFHPFFNDFTPNIHHYYDIYTSPEQYINYLKVGLPPENKNGFGLNGIDNAEIFKYATITTSEDGSVTFTLVNSNLTAEQQTKLAELAEWLGNHSKCFRDGKMYYTYTLGDIVRNNAYYLTLQNSSISGIGRPTP